jgi:hypothetical protein
VRDELRHASRLLYFEYAADVSVQYDKLAELFVAGTERDCPKCHDARARLSSFLSCNIADYRLPSRRRPAPEIDRYWKNLPESEPMRPYVVAPGTIEPRKNIDLVLLALQRTRNCWHSTTGCSSGARDG